MPKSKKNTRKASSSRLRRITNLLKPNSPKKGLLLFAVVFALAGGGYAVYKSHAQSWTVGVEAFSEPRDGRIAEDTNSTNKGRIMVAKLGSPDIYGYLGRTSVKIYTAFPHEQAVFVCATARFPVMTPSPGSEMLAATSRIQDPGYGSYTLGYNGTTFPIYQSTSYREYCFPNPVKVPAGTHFLYVDLTTQGATTNDGSPPVYVYQVTIKW